MCFNGEVCRSTHAEHADPRLHCWAIDIEWLRWDFCGIMRLYASRYPSSIPTEKRLEHGYAILAPRTRRPSNFHLTKRPSSLGLPSRQVVPPFVSHIRSLRR